MSCPLFEDFTRGCIEEFPEFVKYTNYDLCESDKHQDCPMYFIISSKFKCEYLQICSSSFHKGAPKFIEKVFIDENVKRDIISNLAKKYCVSEENHQNCMRYKLLSQGKKPPLTLLPDGRKIHLTDMLLRKRIIVDGSE